MSEPASPVVLAVDDEFLVLDVVVAALTDGGYEVVRARTASEAMTILRERAADLAGIVTDVNLGRGQSSGWELARLARELKPEIAIVYLTGDSAHEWEVHGVPGSALVDKPFAAIEVVVALAQARTTS